MAKRQPDRGGAPKENLNAFKHGHYVGGRKFENRKRNKHISELGQTLQREVSSVRRLERHAYAQALGKTISVKSTSLFGTQDWAGQKLRRRIRGWIREQTSILKKRNDKTTSSYNAICASRDVLHCLSQEPANFVSAEEFLRAMRRVFLVVNAEEWQPLRPEPYYFDAYWRHWRAYCAALYDMFNPRPPRAKRRPNIKKSNATSAERVVPVL